MRQFEVVANASPDTCQQIPFLLVLQADLLDELATRVVAPLIPLGQYGPPLDKLNPVVAIDGDSYVVSIAELAGIPVRALGERVTSILDDRLEIISALDFLITGS